MRRLVRSSRSLHGSIMSTASIGSALEKRDRTENDDAEQETINVTRTYSQVGFDILEFKTFY